MRSTCRSCLRAWSCSRSPVSSSPRASVGSKAGWCRGPRIDDLMPKLAVRNLSKWFGTLEALRNLNIEIERGGFVSVVGPSGCGKTTFLRIVAGLEPATSGEVQLDGRTVKGPGGDRGFVF